jgi:tRNA (guanine-N7-)-methyltransferase
MRLRNIKGSKEFVKTNQLVLNEPKNHKGRWSEFFSNNNPIHIEIGMGRGQFIVEHAKRYPDINFIGIEKYSGVLYKALKGFEEEQLPNLICLRVDAQWLEDIFEPEEIGCIYLNFSDPWPKDRHEKRRLTNKMFLKIYHALLPEGCPVVFKTDNNDLFEFSLASFRAYGFAIDQLTRDLHKTDPVDNIMTEYEEKFSSQGDKINRLIALTPKKEIR